LSSYSNIFPAACLATFQSMDRGLAKGVLFLAAALLLAGCASGPPLVKDRYAGEPGGLGINPPDVRVSAVALERPAPARGIALTALAPEAQAEMVKAHEVVAGAAGGDRADADGCAAGGDRPSQG
jgi:hypothetical protein